MRSVVDLSTGVVSHTSVVLNAMNLTQNKILLSVYISCLQLIPLKLLVKILHEDSYTIHIKSQ